MLFDGLARLQQVLVELLVDSQQLQAQQARQAAPVARSYRALARACARQWAYLERQAQRQECLPPGHDHFIPLRLAALLDRAAENEHEWTLLQRLFETGQYLALVERLTGQLRPASVRGRRRGMGRLTRCLGERSLRLKTQGISWSGLLGALIQELQAEPTLDAEGQVLLHRLLDLRAVAHPKHSGAYLRLTVARYKADTARRAVTPAPDGRPA